MSPDRILPGSAGVPDPKPQDELAIESDGLLDEIDGATEEFSDVLVGTDDDIAIDADNDGAAAPVAIAVDESEEDSLSADLVATPVEHKGVFRRIYYGETRIDFVRPWRIWFSISLIVILAGVISLGVRGLNYSIDFVGGTSWTVPSKTLTVSQATNAVSGTVQDPTVTALGVYGSDHRTIEVEAKLPKGQSTADQQAIADEVSSELAKASGKSVDDIAVVSVGPSWGSEITKKALEALIVFFILIAIYISIFFEWRMALAAIIAVIHDILVTVGIYSISGFQVTPDTVVAFLTILGYSLYDTIVVFDRVRDNTRHLTVRDRLTITDVVNLSMNQTLARSINTSLVAIIPILAMLILGAEILGANTLQYFGLALLIGLATGAYSSIFIASPLVALMKEREQKYRIIRERLSVRGGDHVLLSASAVARGAFGPSGLTSSSVARQAEREAQRANPVAKRPVQTRRPSSRSKPKGGRR